MHRGTHHGPQVWGLGPCYVEFRKRVLFIVKPKPAQGSHSASSFCANQQCVEGMLTRHALISHQIHHVHVACHTVTTAAVKPENKIIHDREIVTGLLGITERTLLHIMPAST